MRAWRIHRRSIDSLSLDAVPRPMPGPDEVLVRVGAVSLNYRDLLVADGSMVDDLPVPFVLASDMAGTIVAAGKDVDDELVGTRVMSHFLTDWLDGETRPSDALMSSLGGPLPGVLAEYVALPAHTVVPTPAHLSDEEASTLPIAGLTAWQGLFGADPVLAGQVVLTQGTGGVSLFAAQLAIAVGAKVILTSGIDQKLDRAGKIGPMDRINYCDTPDWDRHARDLTDGVGVDKVIDIAGGQQLERSIASLGTGGEAVAVGFVDGDRASLSVLDVIVKNARIRGITGGSHEEFKRFAQAVSTLGVHPVIDRVYPLEDAPEAFERMKEGPFGKVVIRVQEPEPVGSMHQPVSA